MVKYRARAGPPTLAGRLRLLNDELQALAGRLREAIAGAVAGAAASAVRDALRRLLGAPEPPPRRGPPREVIEDFDDGGWDELDEGLWPDEGAEPAPLRERDGAAGPMLRAAVAAGLCWLRRLPGRRPALAAVLLGAAACVSALAAGPAAAACAGIVASAAGLLLTADAARAAAALLAALA
jgi:hypothetical protein